MKRMKRRSLLIIASFVLALGFATMVIPGHAMADSDKKHFKVAWSHYTGWEPWGYIKEYGLDKKWGDKYGIAIEVSPPIDYMESINLYTVGKYDACVMTNMDMLTIPAVGGIDSIALIPGDTSHGNDGVVLRNASSFKDIKGRKVRIVELSVSHYLLTRALDQNKMTEKDLTLINTSDADIASLFTSDTDPKAAVVTWNPQLMQVRNAKGSTMVFDSSMIPGEIIDLLVVKADVPDTFKRALVGMWFEAMAIMNGHDQVAREAIQYMAKASGATENEFRSQLNTTAMMYTPADAVRFAADQKLKQTMEYVRSFCFDHGLYGEGKSSKDFVGIQFSDGTIMGDAKNVKMRFDKTYIQMAADGKL